MSRLSKSISAHQRLAKKHHKDYSSASKGPSWRANSLIKRDYHETVANIQKTKKRILTQQEKEQVFKQKEIDLYNFYN